MPRLSVAAEGGITALGGPGLGGVPPGEGSGLPAYKKCRPEGGGSPTGGKVRCRRERTTPPEGDVLLSAVCLGMSFRTYLPRADCPRTHLERYLPHAPKPRSHF